MLFCSLSKLQPTETVPNILVLGIKIIKAADIDGDGQLDFLGEYQ